MRLDRLQHRDRGVFAPADAFDQLVHDGDVLGLGHRQRPRGAGL